mmetsp:Transcript_37872/g.57948  ORF Transcript_37872/g.57948 Transcript_37872/m.57948 type:complete len:102 (-) Transcript_37872:1724-2029(-)
MAFESKQDLLLEAKIDAMSQPTMLDTLKQELGCDQAKLLSLIKGSKAGFCQGKLFIPSAYLAEKRKELQTQLTSKLFLRKQDVEAMHPPAKLPSLVAFLRE